MLRISTKQQETVAISLFAQRLLDHWKDSFPSRLNKLSESQITEIVNAAIEEARKLGIEKEIDIVTWTDLCLVSKLGFA